MRMGPADPDAMEAPLGRMWFDLRFPASIYECALDIEAPVGTSLAVGWLGIPELLRSRDFERVCCRAESLGAGDCDIAVDTGAGVSPEAVTVFGAAVEVPLAPPSKA